jgi:hypothetical protein
MYWGSIPLEGILLYIYDFFAYFELVMVLWNADHPLIVIRHNKIKNGVQKPPSRHASHQFSIHNQHCVAKISP